MSDKKILTETEALAEAKKQGIEFVDFYTVEGDETKFATREKAEEAHPGKNIIQTRTQK
jgi:hypothetical protein